MYIYIYSSHEILTNWLINVDNFVQRQSALLKLIEYTNVCKYIFIPLIYIFFNKEVGGGGSWSFCYVIGGPYPSEVWEALV